MATAVTTSKDNEVRPVGDYLLTGVLVMLVINAVQRVVGLLRGLGFCRFLSEQELGGWALANSFFVIAVPIALLGLPGSFGKFTEYFRHRRQLGDYIVHVLIAAGLGLTVAVAWMLLYSDSFNWLVLGGSASRATVGWCITAFVCLTLYSVVYELVGSLRYVRTVSIMQFSQSVLFALLGLPAIAIVPTWTVLLPCFALANLLAVMPGLWVLAGNHSQELRPTGQIEKRAMWQKILPYAGALWLLNLLSNLFEVSDRYMLLHLTAGGVELGQAAVGQYHCGRILPNLLTSVALMLGGVFLPYLSADWEAGRRDQIRLRMKHMIQSVAIGFMALAAGAMAVAPWLFEYGFGGRYQLAESILPLSLLHATWVGLFLVAETYMLCVERGKQVIALLAVALCVNLAMNWYLIQAMGLVGAVIATAASGFLALVLLLWSMQRAGCRIELPTAILCFVPLVIPCGAIVTACVLCLIAILAGRTDWLLNDEDRQQIDETIVPWLRKLRLPIQTIWP